jgi:tol-pal system protein YbgF
MKLSLFNFKFKTCTSCTLKFTGGTLFFLFFLFIISGCSARQNQTSNDDKIELKLIEKRLSIVEDKIDKVYNRLSVIQFMVDDHEQKLKVSGNSDISDQNKETKAEKSKKKPEEPAGLNPNKLYSKGLNFLKEKQYKSALDTFDQFLDKFPENSLADNALYWKGETYYTQKEYSKAAETFKMVTEKYPDGSKCPDALLKEGYSYIELSETKKAEQTLQKLIKLYPFSSAAPKAEVKLKEIF